MSKLISQLYLHGLALGDFDLALRGLLGEDAPVSASTVARLKEEWQAEWCEWKQRSLEGLQVVYLWVDGVICKGWTGVAKGGATGDYRWSSGRPEGSPGG